MFSITVSVVLIVYNGILLIKDDGKYRIPGGNVRASEETIQFAAVRNVKEQTGVILQKDALIPVDFRSDPDRTESKNEVDIGFVTILTNIKNIDDYIAKNPNLRWEEVDFENRCLIKKVKLYMDHDVLIERAITISCLIKE